MDRREIDRLVRLAEERAEDLAVEARRVPAAHYRAVEARELVESAKVNLETLPDSVEGARANYNDMLALLEAIESTGVAFGLGAVTEGVLPQWTRLTTLLERVRGKAVKA